MTNLYKVFHLAGLTAAAAIVIAATQDLSAEEFDAPSQPHFGVSKPVCAEVR
jgi:hypothetical protein